MFCDELVYRLYPNFTGNVFFRIIQSIIEILLCIPLIYLLKTFSPSVYGGTITQEVVEVNSKE